MHESIDASSQRVAAARAQGDSAALAQALLQHANALAQLMRLEEAVQAVDEAVALHRARGAADDERRCLLVGAEMLRLLGRTAAARERATRALSGASPADTAQAQALLGGIALAEGDAAAAEAAFDRALQLQPDGAAPAWWRGRAQARATLGRFADAAQDMQAAQRRCVEVGDRAAARRAAIEAATAWHSARRFDRAAHLIDDTLADAQADADHAALGALHVLRATQSLEHGDASAARTQLLAAREQALLARAPDVYISAAVALSRLADHAGDRLQAYAALATGWATVSDLLGALLAGQTFKPLLKALRERWGAADFDAARAAYEAERRSAGATKAQRG